MTDTPIFIFDCDGTLIDSMGMWLEIQPKLLASYGMDLTADDFAKFESLSVEDECKAYHEEWGVGESGEAVFARFDTMLLEEYRTNIHARSGVRAFLEEAERAGVVCAIATSTPEHLVRAGLAANDLERFFPVIVTTEMAGRSKDFPDVYNLTLARACEFAGVEEPPHGEVWVFEDAPFGLKSAGGAGYRTVGIFDPHGRGTREEVFALADLPVDEFTELTLDRVMG